MTVEGYINRGQRLLTQAAMDRRLRRFARGTAFFGVGFLLGAASLGSYPQPFAIALVSTMTGWRAGVMALGAGCGYLHFWGAAGAPGIFWAMLTGLMALTLGKGKRTRGLPWLMPSLCALITSATGLAFQFFGRRLPVGIYLLQVILALLSARLFARGLEKREKGALWCIQAICVLALAQVGTWVNLGQLMAGALAVWEVFPGAALAGVALDLAQVTPVPMTAVLCMVCLIRMVPGVPQWGRLLAPGAVYLLVMGICGQLQPMPLPGLLLGGLGSVLLPRRRDPERPRDDVGLIQTRLELSAQVLSQGVELLQEVPEPPLDEDALMARCRERACGGCPNRRACHVPAFIPRELLRRPLVENTALPFPCKKPGRMILELRRTQEQYRCLRADRERRREYRGAVVQQYGFLSEYLAELSGDLSRRGKGGCLRYTPEAARATRSREEDNGDRFRHFSGPGQRYYVLLCDGMGTGFAAAQEGRRALEMLHKMLTGGLPATRALESLNSLLVLGGRTGAVTVDLAELHLDTGMVSLYKWGAAPSYLLRDGTAEKIGTAGPPPGIGVSNAHQEKLRLSLGGGETLILVSDGVDGEEARRCAVTLPGGDAGELAARLLECGAAASADDATVAVVRLHPLAC